MRKSVVVSDGGVTALQLSNFFRKVHEGTIDGCNLQQFMQEPSRFAPDKTDIDRAVKLLGAEKVVHHDDWAKVWNRPVTQTDAGILTFGTPGVLQSAADMNKAGHTDFRLVYCGGISLREQRDYFGTDTKKQPCYYSGSTWWLDEKNDSWATFSPQPGYRLLDYKLRYRSTKWQAQEDTIAQLGTGYSRAHETDVAEGCFSFYQIHEGKRLLSDAYHWGQSLDSIGDRVCVGFFVAVGFYVLGDVPSKSHGDLGVVVARN